MAQPWSTFCSSWQHTRARLQACLCVTRRSTLSATHPCLQIQQSSKQATATVSEPFWFRVTRQAPVRQTHCLSSPPWLSPCPLPHCSLLNALGLHPVISAEGRMKFIQRQIPYTVPRMIILFRHPILRTLSQVRLRGVCGAEVLLLD